MSPAPFLSRLARMVAVLGTVATWPTAHAAPTAEQALHCQVVYQLDYIHTKVPGRAKADREGAEVAFELYRKLGRNTDDVSNELARQRWNPDMSAVPAKLKPCDLLFNPGAVNIPTAYGNLPPPTKLLPEAAAQAAGERPAASRPAPPAAGNAGKPTAPSASRQQNDACERADQDFDAIVRDFERQIDRYLRGSPPRPVPLYQYNNFRSRLLQLESRAGKACPELRSVIQEIQDWTEENIAIE